MSKHPTHSPASPMTTGTYQQLKSGRSNLITIDISALAVSDDPNATLVTYALGSCIAVMLHDPKRLVAGLIHYMLPLSSVNRDKAKTKPAMFADTGIPLLFQTMYEFGCKKEDLVVKVAGGGALYDDKGTFNIGKRNYTVLRKMFWKNQVLITAEDVGGAKSRTTYLHTGSGRVLVKSQGEEYEL
jgi:chemotaxis protein CheD